MSSWRLAHKNDGEANNKNVDIEPLCGKCGHSLILGPRRIITTSDDTVTYTLHINPCVNCRKTPIARRKKKKLLKQ